MILVKRLLSMLRGERGPALQPAVAVARPAHPPGTTAATLSPDARFGHYQILEVLEHSPRGAVYRARDDRHGRQVALKIPDVAARGLPLLRARLETQGRMMAILNHPNVQEVYELGEELGTLYLAVELVVGTSLKTAIAQGTSLTVGLRALVDVLAGLAAVHQRRVVHRNINPENIIIQDHGSVTITGFDMAVRFHDSVARDGHTVGTPAYMSPEQAEGRMLDGRSDLFSVGCLLYELTTGRLPFQAETVTEMLEKIDHQEPVMSGFAQGVEWKALGIVIARALRRNADERFADATAFSAALTGALQGLRDEVLPPHGGGNEPRFYSSR